MQINFKNQIRNYSDDLIKPNQIKTKNILIENFEDLVIYCTRYVNCESMKMLSLLIRTKKLMVADYVLDKILEKKK